MILYSKGNQRDSLKGKRSDTGESSFVCFFVKKTLCFVNFCESARFPTGDHSWHLRWNYSSLISAVRLSFSFAAPSSDICSLGNPLKDSCVLIWTNCFFYVARFQQNPWTSFRERLITDKQHNKQISDTSLKGTSWISYAATLPAHVRDRSAHTWLSLRLESLLPGLYTLMWLIWVLWVVNVWPSLRQDVLEVCYSTGRAERRGWLIII